MEASFEPVKLNYFYWYANKYKFNKTDLKYYVSSIFSN